MAIQWWNLAWHKRRKLTINNGTSSTLTNVPVLVVLNSIRIDYSHTQSAGQDLRFVANDQTTILKYEIEKWNESGTSYVWVKAPSLANGETQMWMYYGNSTASAGEDENNVWDSNFLMVQHLEEATSSGTGWLDSTANANNSTAHKIDGAGSDNNATGQINGAVQLDGADDYIEVNSVASDISVTTGTIEMWLASNTTAQWTDNATHHLIFAQKDANNIIRLSKSTLNAIDHVYRVGGVNYLATFSPSSPGTAFHYLVGSWDDSSNEVKVYWDGLLKDTSTTSFNQIAGPMTDVIVGANANFANNWDGKLDEIRISSVVRSADWIAFQYSNTIDNTTTFGTEELRNSALMSVGFNF